MPTPFPVRLLRIGRIGLHLLHGVLKTLFWLPRMVPSARDECIRAWSGKFLTILNIRVVCHGHVPTTPPQRALIVANHISWIDIWAIKQAFPVNFVAKSEVRNWPIIGWLAQQVGTLFIERARRHDTGRTASSMEAGLRDHACLCLFPEGTTTDGTDLKPFKTGLLQSAINTEATVWPVALRYPTPDGRINTGIAYDGDTTLLESMLAVLKQREITVELHFAEPIVATGAERRHLSHQARHAISSLLHLPKHKGPDTPAGLPDAAP